VSQQLRDAASDRFDVRSGEDGRLRHGVRARFLPRPAAVLGARQS
jgi:hypothetical protein